MKSAIEGSLTLAGLAAVLVWPVVRVDPLRLLSRSLDYARAAFYTAREMGRGAWARRDRWRECLERAQRER